ncbi:STAS/SEC14 domain-containing protein [Dokdonella sp.]|uniref:STAS/SEC14 domain-containing protein n=1 Tax=Dokdonella sp. TaxID=2291710 RepID=UPI0035283A42
MIKLIAGLPEHVIGFELSGKVSAEDYEKVLMPAVDAATAGGQKIGLLYHITPEFEKYEFEAMWDDAKVGFRHLASWKKIAVVTDVDWIRWSVKSFGFAMPGQVRVFDQAGLAAAREWLAE